MPDPSTRGEGEGAELGRCSPARAPTSGRNEAPPPCRGVRSSRRRDGGHATPARRLDLLAPAATSPRRATAEPPRPDAPPWPTSLHAHAPPPALSSSLLEEAPVLTELEPLDAGDPPPAATPLLVVPPPAPAPPPAEPVLPPVPAPLLLDAAPAPPAPLAVDDDALPSGFSQLPAWQVPPAQCVPSAFAGAEQSPVAESHAPSSWQSSLAAQLFGDAPVHTPARQVSVCVHLSPSSHDAPSALAGSLQVPVW